MKINFDLLHCIKFSFFMLMFLLIIVGCENYTPFHENKRPEDFPFHTHKLNFYVRSINQDKDTIGVMNAVMPFKKYLYERSPWGREVSWFIYDFPEVLNIEIIKQDTNFHNYETEVNHFVGCQMEHGGDTLRLSCLDNICCWGMKIYADIGNTILESGDTMKLDGHFFRNFPDTIKGDTIQVEITFDWDGLFWVRHFAEEDVIDVKENRIYIKQR